MQTSAFRVEVIRFSLLVTMTVALLSVAIRLASHSDSHSAAQTGPRGDNQPAATATSNATSPGSTPATTAPRATSSPAPTSTSPGAPGSGSSGGSSGGASTQPVLPVTGYDAALKLGALSLILIGAGGVAVRASRR